ATTIRSTRFHRRLLSSAGANRIEAPARPCGCDGNRHLLRHGVTFAHNKRYAGRSTPAISALCQKQTCAVQKGMSALPPKADMCSATRYVRFVPKADIRAELDVCCRAEVDIGAYSRSVSARMINEFGSVIPRDLAAFRLRANSNRVGRSIGKSVGRAPLRTLSMYPATRRISSLVLGP